MQRTPVHIEHNETLAWRLPVEVRLQLLEAIYAGQPFRTVLRDLGLSSNRVLGSPGLTRSGRRGWML